MYKNCYDTANYGTDLNFMSMVNATHAIAFFGESLEDVTMFVAGLSSLDSLVLVVDFSSNKKLFLNTVGDVNNQAIVFHKVCYTCDEKYFQTYKNCYDTVLIYSDIVHYNPNVMGLIDFAYLSFGVQKYSFVLLKDMLSKITCYTPFDLICRATQKMAEQQLINETLQMLCIKRNKPEHIFYVPNDMKDMDNLLKFGYGVLDISQLSQPMNEVVIGACNRLKRMAGKSLSSTNSYIKPVVRWMM